MHFKVKLLVFLLYGTLCYCKKSFSLITDTTLSMQEEIDDIKRNIGKVFDSVDLTDIEDFVLVPFKDPDVGPIQTFSSHTDLMSNLNLLGASGGNECPENALAAIEKALEVSKPDSLIFVFTDAFANDNDTSKLAEVQRLCLSSRSQVVIFLSGSCVRSGREQEGSIDVYFDVARSCKGGLYQFQLDNLKQAFTVMKEIIKTNWTEVKTHDVVYNSDIMLSVGSATANLMITVYGSCRSLQIYDKDGLAVNLYKTIDTANVLVVRFTELIPGNYRASFNCQGRTSITVYKRNDLPIKIGFSTMCVNNLKLTSSRPLPGYENYVLLVIPPDSTIKLTTLTIYDINKNVTTEYGLTEDEVHKGQYTTAELSCLRYYFDHGTSFQITVSGHDLENNLDVTKKTKILETQKALWSSEAKEVPETKPTVEIITETTLIEYETTPRIFCKATGYPEPVMTWHGTEGGDSGNFTIEIPNIFASYADIIDIKDNITVRCSAKNSIGEHEQSLELFVKRTISFEEIQTLKDETIEFGAERTLYCKIKAYPEVTITWYHNDTLLSSYNLPYNIEITSDNQELVIKNMTLDDTGIYKCEVKSDIEHRSYTANIDISGIEAPEIELERTEVNLQPGDWTQLDCVGKGKPLPEISWKYKKDNEDYATTIPDGVDIDVGKLRIASARTEHSGVYRCEASNILGLDYRDVTVKIQYAPIINNVPERLAVNEGDKVELECSVTAEPAATVRWGMTRDGFTVALGERFTIDDHHTLRFQALAGDSGDYHCIAENAVGRKEESVRVDVTAEVYIQTPQYKTMTVRAGSSVTLPCNILEGNPTPSVKWEFVSSKLSRTLVLFRGNSAINNLRLSNVSKENEGAYICIASNGITSDTIKIDLIIQ